MFYNLCKHVDQKSIRVLIDYLYFWTGDLELGKLGKNPICKREKMLSG